MSHAQPYQNGAIREDYSRINVSRKERVYISYSVVIVIGVIASIMILNGFFNNEGMSPANERGAAKTSILSDPLDTGEVKGRVISHNKLSPIGATVLAYKSFGFSASFEKNGGYTTKSTISIDGTFNLDVPSGVYNLIVFYNDGTHDVIKDFAVQPNTTRTLQFNY